MPFQPINFAGIPLQEGFKIPDLVQKWKEGVEAGQYPTQIKQKAEADRIANALRQAQTEKLQREGQSPFGGQQLRGPAGEAWDLELLGRAVGKDSPVYQNAEKRFQTRLNMGFGSAPIRMQANVIENLMKDNPDFTEQQAREAADAFLSGGDTSDIKVSGITKQALNSLVKYGTDSSARNFLISGGQAEAELPYINEAIKKGLGHYETNIAGWRPGLSRDTALAQTGDKAAINRLSDWVVKDILALEGIQLQQRLQTGKVTVTASDELLNRNKLEGVGTFNSLPGSVQVEVVDKMNELLKKLFSARKKAGINPVDVIGGKENKKEEKHIPTWNSESGDFE